MTAPHDEMKTESADSTPVEIYAAIDPIESHVLGNRLIDEGIEVTFVGDQLGSAMGEIPCGLDVSPRIWVAANQAEQARNLIKQWQDEARKNRPPESNNEKLSTLIVKIMIALWVAMMLYSLTKSFVIDADETLDPSYFIYVAISTSLMLWAGYLRYRRQWDYEDE